MNEDKCMKETSVFIRFLEKLASGNCAMCVTIIMDNLFSFIFFWK